jgi:hypothetical protein
MIEILVAVTVLWRIRAHFACAFPDKISDMHFSEAANGPLHTSTISKHIKMLIA